MLFKTEILKKRIFFHILIIYWYKYKKNKIILYYIIILWKFLRKNYYPYKYRENK